MGQPSQQIEGSELGKLKVLHISSTDVAGGRFNGFSTLDSICAFDIEGRMSVWRKESADERVWTIYSRARYFTINRIINRIERMIGVQGLLHVLSLRYLFDRRVRWADVLHLHLVHNGFFSLLILPILTRIRPVIWTIHDTWAMTGRCIQPLECNGWKTGCGICPDLSTYFPTRFDLSAFQWKLKRLIYGLSKVHLIVASQAMAQMVSQSPLLSRFQVHLVPFGVDNRKFRPVDREGARKRLGVIPGNKVVVFRAHGGAYKGLKEAISAINELAIDSGVTVITLDERGRADRFRGRYQIIDIGWTNSDDEMVDVYNAADVFLMPSFGEAFGMMAVEAMACGTPVLCFEGTALPWVVGSPNAGIAVPRGDFRSLGQKLSELLNNESLRQKHIHACLELVRTRYSLDEHLVRLKAAYNSCIESWKD